MTRSTFPYPYQPDEGPGRPIPAWLIVGLLVLFIAIVIFLAPREVTAPSRLLSDSGAMSIAANPELMAYQLYQAEDHALAASIFAARYPELRLVDRYQPELARAQKEAFLAENPELRAFFAYALVDGHLDSAFLAANPEVGIYRRYQAANR